MYKNIEFFVENKKKNLKEKNMCKIKLSKKFEMIE